MSTTKTNADHKANQLNDNKGTSGTNKANAAVHGNKGAQLNPNNPKNK
ncbi:MAG: alpha-amylase [Ghiorsea sp.]|nr:alpha-amylase [Ghiorsea sp.]